MTRDEAIREVVEAIEGNGTDIASGDEFDVPAIGGRAERPTTETRSKTMDANEILRLLRLTIGQWRVDTDDGVRRAHAREVVEYVEALDAYLSAGGTPPEVWREGPDAVGTETGPEAVGEEHPLPCRECGALDGHNYPCDSAPEPGPLGTLTCPIHGVVPEQDGGGCRLCDEGEEPDLPPFYGNPIDTPVGHWWAGHSNG